MMTEGSPISGILQMVLWFLKLSHTFPDYRHFHVFFTCQKQKSTGIGSSHQKPVDRIPLFKSRRTATSPRTKNSWTPTQVALRARVMAHGAVLWIWDMQYWDVILASRRSYKYHLYRHILYIYITI